MNFKAQSINFNFPIVEVVERVTNYGGLVIRVALVR
jgi:hypothetical protein